MDNFYKYFDPFQKGLPNRPNWGIDKPAATLAYLSATLLMLIIGTTGAFAQSSPGCLAPRPTNWLRADYGVTLNGSNVSSWQDYGTALKNATQGTAINQPAFGATTTNFNPGFTFNGGSQFLNADFTSIYNGQYAIFMSGVYDCATGDRNSIGSVSNAANAGLQFRIYDNSSGGNNPFTDLYECIINSGSYFSQNAAGPGITNGGITGNNCGCFGFSHLTYGGLTTSGLDLELIRSGATTGTLHDATVTTPISGTATNYIGRHLTSNYFAGTINEIITFDRQLNATEIDQVLSYLAVKYGRMFPRNYLSGTGTTIWDRTLNTGFNNDVAGIGREDCQDLYQKQSISEFNTQNYVIMGNGNTITASNLANTSTFTNGAYLLWGDNRGADSYTAINSGTQIWDKVWRVQETNTVGSVRVAVPQSSVPLPSGFTNMYLLVTPGNTSVPYASLIKVPVTSTTLFGLPYWVADYDFTTGQYFTFGVENCVAGTNAPALSATTISITCPTVTVDLSSLTASNQPSGTVLEFHTATPVSSANLISAPSAYDPSTATSTVYAVFYDAAVGCYSPTTAVTVNTDVPCITDPAPQTALTLEAKSGDAATELSPTGGTTSYVYTNGSGDPLCVQPVAATAGYLPNSSNLTINSSTGAYTYTAPATPGVYYFCVKVCDSSNPARCKVAAYTVTVTCRAGTTAPTLSETTITNTCPTQTVDLSSITASNKPAGTDLTFHTGTPASNANKISNPSAYIPTGCTVYAAFNDGPGNCYSPTTAISVNLTLCVGAGTINCAKTQIYSAPTVGTAQQLVLVVELNITTLGSFPVSVSGSGFSAVAGYPNLVATATGTKQYSIPVNYDGSALGTLTFTIGSAGSCSVDLTTVAPKNGICNIISLDNCTPVQASPILK